MKSIITITLLFLLITSCFGQKKDTTYHRLYFSIHAGTTILSNYDASVGVGYRLNELVTFGVDYRVFTYSLFAHSDGGSINGLNAFFEYDQGIYIKLGVGLPLKVRYDENFECIPCFEYKYVSKTGYYLFGSVGYHFKSGFVLGINLSKAESMIFDTYLVDFEKKTSIFDHVRSNVGLAVFTINIGYTLRATQ